MTSKTLSPQELAVLRAKIAEAEAAYHRLMIGGAVREVVDQNGERIAYTAASKQGLYSYILTLKAQLPEGDCDRPVAARPLRFLF
jgi:hypothetical protein